MEVFKRIFLSALINGLLNALLLIIAALILIFSSPPKSGFLMIDGRYLLIYVAAVIGVIGGCVIGCLIGLLETSIITSAALGGFLIVIAALGMTDRTALKNEPVKGVLFILIIAGLGALSSGITARIFSKSSLLE